MFRETQRAQATAVNTYAESGISSQSRNSLIFRQIVDAGLHNSHLHTTEAEHHADYFETSKSPRRDSTIDLTDRPTDGRETPAPAIDIASISGVTTYLLIIARRNRATRRRAGIESRFIEFLASPRPAILQTFVLLFAETSKRGGRRGDKLAVKTEI